MAKKGRKKIYFTKEQKRLAHQVVVNNWHKEHTKAFTLRFMVKSSSDVIEKLESVENKTDYIRNLIRADIERENNK